ncbi:hypothetical protein [Rubrivirga sp. IMCC45206]|uniref:hypothetical protein n=1 Tax=Rubrivirga sp. IMCC45206 TaxID=3391614 RepID=UPI00398F9703
MTRFLAPLVLLLAFGLTACDSTAEFVVGGTYFGQSNDQVGFVADLTLVIPTTESGDTFAFTGTLNQEGAAIESISGTGRYDHPAITLTADGETIVGTVSADGSALTIDDDTGLGAFALRRQ